MIFLIIIILIKDIYINFFYILIITSYNIIYYTYYLYTDINYYYLCSINLIKEKKENWYFIIINNIKHHIWIEIYNNNLNKFIKYIVKFLIKIINLLFLIDRFICIEYF